MQKNLNKNEEISIWDNGDFLLMIAGGLSILFVLSMGFALIEFLMINPS